MLRGGFAERIHDLWHVVAINHDCFPAEGTDALGVGIDIAPKHGFASLAEPVDIDDADEIRRLVIRCQLNGLPLRAFRHLTVAEQYIRAVGKVVETAGIERHAESDTKTLAQ